MALKNITLDAKIIESAKTEFMNKGFKKASLISIARKTGITTGALYSRYKSKDDLFCSLVDEVFMKLLNQGEELRAMYMSAGKQHNTDELLFAIKQEEAVYFSIIYKYYEESILLFCKAQGSSVEKKVNDLMAKKVNETYEFLSSLTNRDFDRNGMEFILYEQLTFFSRILENRYPKDKALECMETVEDFLMAGWKNYFEKIL